MMFEIFVFALAAGALVAIVAAFVSRPREPEFARLSGPPCPATVKLLADATEFEAAIDWTGAPVRMKGGAAETADTAFFVEHVRAALTRLGPVDLLLEPSRFWLRLGRRLEGDEQPRFIAVAYSIVQHAIDVQSRRARPAV